MSRSDSPIRVPRPISVALVEDDLAFRASVRMLLDASPSFRCVATWPKVEDAVRGVCDPEPDLVLLDIHLPGRAGDEGVVDLRARFPEALVLMFTGSAEEERVFRSLCHGASGYLLKSIEPKRLLEALSEAFDGGSPMSPVIARKVVAQFRQSVASTPIDASLTPREVELLALLAEGRSYQQGAEALNVSVNTVRNYIRSIYEKLQVHTKSEAVSKALRAGLI